MNAAGAPWEKVLWRKQPFPDNYVHTSFLSQLRTNATAEFPRFETIALSSLAIVQRLMTIMLFVALFVHLYQRTISAHVLMMGSLLGTFLLGCISFLCPTNPSYTQYESLLHSVPSLGVLILALHALSPVLRTFSEATTSDSIWAFAAVLFSLHFALADYSTETKARPLFSATLSLNLAMCASVVLSSRLQLDVDVFALLLVALQIFAIMPLLIQRIYAGLGKLKMRDGHLIPWAVLPLTLLFSATSIMIMLPLSRFVALILIPGTIGFLSIFCPLWMRKSQRWKREMRGPWDEAVPQAPFIDSLV